MRIGQKACSDTLDFPPGRRVFDDKTELMERDGPDRAVWNRLPREQRGSAFLNKARSVDDMAAEGELIKKTGEG